MIFEFFNGKEQLEADADVLRARLDKHGPELFRELEADEKSPKARQIIRQMFELPTPEEGGLNDDEVMSLLDGYLTLIRKREADNEEVQPQEQADGK